MSNFVRTFKARKAFLDELAVGSSISMAATVAGGTSSVFRAWRASDPEFAKDWDDAIEEGTDVLEDAAFDRAVKKSDALAMFMLKARRPDKFDRGSKLELSGGISVEGSKQTLLNKIARIQAQGKLASGGDEAESEVPEEEQPEVLSLPAPEEQPTAGDGVPVRGRKRRRAAA